MIYLDNASTTQISQTALNKYLEISQVAFNPSTLYSLGINSHRIIDDCKAQMLKLLRAQNGDNIIFTSCATESNNQVLNSFVAKNYTSLISAGEHASIYNTAKTMQNNGYNIEFISLTKDGVVDIEDFKNKMTPSVGFVSIIHVSNETGAISDIKQLVKIAKEVNPNVIFHSDGVQAFGKIDLSVRDLDVDLYSVSAHKLHGPKGVGALYVKKGVKIKPFLIGGGQENGLRSGTENVAGIAAFTVAAEEMVSHLKTNFDHVSTLKAALISKLNQLKNCTINVTQGSPYILSCAFKNVRGETLLHMLESNQIYVGNGSACNSKNAENRVLENMGIDKNTRLNSIRISFINNNTIDDVNNIVDTLKRIIV